MCHYYNMISIILFLIIIFEFGQRVAFFGTIFTINMMWNFQPSANLKLIGNKYEYVYCTRDLNILKLSLTDTTNNT